MEDVKTRLTNTHEESEDLFEYEDLRSEEKNEKTENKLFEKKSIISHVKKNVYEFFARI